MDDENQMPYHRRSIRLPDHDYAAGAYFVTLCAWQREWLFGEVIEDEVILNTLGCVVEDEWLKTAEIRPYITLDDYVIMPNHFHAILFIDGDISQSIRRAESESRRGDLSGRPHNTHDKHRPNGPKKGSLAAVIAQFKRITTLKINRVRGIKGELVWQRNYYERIIRNEIMLDAFRRYTLYNPARWLEDHEYRAT